MATSTELIQKRSEYYVFIEQLNNVVLNLKKAIDNLNTPINKIKENYSINNESGDKNKLSKIQQSLNNKYSTLTTVIIPSVNSQIENLSKAIETALAEEEAARRALEEQMRPTQAPTSSN